MVEESIGEVGSDTAVHNSLLFSKHGSESGHKVHLSRTSLLLSASKANNNQQS